MVPVRHGNTRPDHSTVNLWLYSQNKTERSSMSPHNQQVIEYFDQTHNDYRRLWGIDRHLGLHCGFFDEAHRRHDAE